MRRAVAGPGDGFTARDWIVVFQRVRKEAKEDNLGLVAAGVAFWAILSIVPLLVGVMAVAAVVSGPAQIRSQLGPLAEIFPRPVARSLTGQLSDAASAMSGQGQTLALIIGLLGVLWTCARGVGAVISGLHIVIDETETRGVIRRRATAFALAAGAVATVMGSLALVSAVPHVALRDADFILEFGIRCVLLALLVVVGLILLYRYGPDRANSDWHAVRWGAGIAMTCWLVMSIGLGVWVAHTGGRSSTYGTLAGAAAIATWLYLSSYIVLLGAEINAEIERLLNHRSAFRDEPPKPTEQVVTVEQPIAAEQLGVAERPRAEQPVSVELPVTTGKQPTEQPTPVENTPRAQQPAAAQRAAVTEQPVPAEQPVAVGKQPAEQPAPVKEAPSAQHPASAERAADAEQPVPAEQAALPADTGAAKR